MLNKRKHNNNYIHINNYNKFLYELDKKQMLINKPKNTEHIHNIINNTNQTFDDLYKQTFDNLCKESNTNNIIKVNINVQINNISDILQIINDYPLDPNIEYNINLKMLHNIKEPLINLDSMIGLNHIKENIVEQILFYIQNLQNSNNDFMHTVIYGPPGTGKTEIAKIIGSIFSKIGILKKSTFKKVTKSDLVAGYLGQTALKTRDVINSSLGGVLFIDEAYSFGSDKIDSFSKECIDILCESLSDHKDKLMVIIAGYENELNDYFFNINKGLNSRFTWRYYIDEYTSEDLYNIFIKKVNDNGWFIDDSNINVKWFELNKKHFKNYGRDIETLLTKVKIAHSKRVFCKDNSEKKKINLNDLENGFKNFIKNEKKEIYNNIIHSLYT
jgi:replication-associated recombination protein RarA